MAKILLKSGDKTFKFANFTLQDSDGSFYVSILREGLSADAKILDCRSDDEGTSFKINEVVGERKKLKKVSYHTTGLVRYHELSIKPVVAFPLTRLKDPFLFFECSIPEIARLDLHEVECGEDDIVLDMSAVASSGRFNAVFLVAPWNYVPKDVELVIARYNNLFSFGVVFRHHPHAIPDGFDNHFLYLSSQASIAEEIQIDKDTALIEFHQRVNDTNSVILYRANGEGVYTMIFSAPMRSEPKVQITFERSDLRIEEVSNTKARLRFKIRDSKNSIFRNEPKIMSIELDSEL